MRDQQVEEDPDEPPDFASILARETGLTSLVVEHMGVSSAIALFLCSDSLSTLTSLTSLSLRKNSLHAVAIRILAHSVAALPALLEVLPS